MTDRLAEYRTNIPTDCQEKFYGINFFAVH